MNDNESRCPMNWIIGEGLIFRLFYKQFTNLLKSTSPLCHCRCCPLEIKENVAPDKRLPRVFGVIDKSPLQLGVGAILCMADHLNAFDKDNLIVPIWMI